MKTVSLSGSPRVNVGKKGAKYEQETFFVKDPNENILEIKTLTANPE